MPQFTHQDARELNDMLPIKRRIMKNMEKKNKGAIVFGQTKESQEQAEEIIKSMTKLKGHFIAWSDDVLRAAMTAGNVERSAIGIYSEVIVRLTELKRMSASAKWNSFLPDDIGYIRQLIDDMREYIMTFQAQEGINVRSQAADEAPRGQARTAERLGHHKVSKYNLAYVLKQTQDAMLFIQQKIAAYNFEREMPTLEGAGMPQRYM